MMRGEYRFHECRFQELRRTAPRPIFVFLLCFVLMLAAGTASAQTTPPACTLDISDAVGVLLQMPAESVLAEAFALGFTMPMTAYLVAYLVGVLVSMFNSH